MRQAVWPALPSRPVRPGCTAWRCVTPRPVEHRTRKPLVIGPRLQVFGCAQLLGQAGLLCFAAANVLEGPRAATWPRSAGRLGGSARFPIPLLLGRRAQAASLLLRPPVSDLPPLRTFMEGRVTLSSGDAAHPMTPGHRPRAPARLSRTLSSSRALRDRFRLTSVLRRRAPPPGHHDQQTLGPRIGRVPKLQIDSRCGKFATW